MLELLGIGIAAGLIASAVMEAFQALAARPFGMGGNDDPSTVKAVDTLDRAVTGHGVAQVRRARTGRLVHYATGAVLGVVYVWAVSLWPVTAIGFGAAYGIVVAVLLDYVVVPAFGWGPPAWKTPLNTHAYGVLAHVVFGVALEGCRQAAVGIFA